MYNHYFLLRHGESTRNLKRIASSWPEKVKAPLTKKGKGEAKKAANILKNKKIDLIFASDLLRTKQTAEIVGKALGIKPKTDKRLREVNVGVFNNKPIDDVAEFWDREGKLSPKEYYGMRFKIAPPKGENYRQLEKRLKSFIKEMERKYKGNNILIVSHQRPITFIERIFYKYGLDKLVRVIMGKKEIKTGEVKKL